eukprot:GHVQ01041952.1.p1 GENE.GHVQ01041952.1~~GHVQ01041952.1.p1  ORF type:complete len:815 (+),score=69.08 GHVQ01041952.1:163-2607(+)
MVDNATTKASGSGLLEETPATHAAEYNTFLEECAIHVEVKHPDNCKLPSQESAELGPLSSSEELSEKPDKKVKRKKRRSTVSGVVGLTTKSVEERRRQYGYNEVIPKEFPEWKKILGRFLGIVPVIMLVTAVLSAAVPSRDGSRDWLSFGMLIFELLLVVFVDYLSDRNAGNAIKAVKDLSAPTCSCKRDKKWCTVNVRELVPGDVVALKGGVVIPADGVLVGKGEPILVDESSLTGEAMAVTKHVGDELMGGAVIQSGELDMEVTSIGPDTFFGKTLALLGTVQSQGHLKKVLQWVAKLMAAVGAIGCGVLFFIKVFRDGDQFAIALKFAFVLLTAVVPIAMPVVTTTVLSVGALELSKESAVVTRLSAIEEMAGIEVLCSDKTGTLTLNKLTLERKNVVPGPTFTEDDVMLMAALSSKHENQEPIDKAITDALGDIRKTEGYEVTRFIPFNPVDKKTIATVTFPDGQTRTISKGAPHIVRNMVAESHPDMVDWMDDIITGHAERGLRTLGVAISDEDQSGPHSWALVGMIALFDPPRDDTARTIERALDYGVDVKMITGDQRAIAIETARMLGMGTHIVGSEVWHSESHLVEQAGGLGQFILGVNGFAAVYPEHKFRIVEALQNLGQLVGMTGDGVNDAPALKKANVGIAVAGATDAAKGAADIILLKPGLSTIINALFISRTIFIRLRNYITYRMASSTLILLFYFFSVIITGVNMPTWTLVLLSIINDFTIMSTSKDQVIPSDKPEKWDMIKISCISGTIGLVCVVECVMFLLLARPAYNTGFWEAFGVASLTVVRIPISHPVRFYLFCY